MYFEHRESVKRNLSHRLLGMQRGEADGIVPVCLELDDEYVFRKLRQQLVFNQHFGFQEELCTKVEDCCRRLLLPATKSTTLQNLKQQADEEAIRVFARHFNCLFSC